MMSKIFDFIYLYLFYKLNYKNKYLFYNYQEDLINYYFKVVFNKRKLPLIF